MSTKKTAFAFDKENYKFLFLGMALTFIGFILMIGGAAENPDEFKTEELYSFTRITLAPFLVILGYGVVFFAIMRTKKNNKTDQDKISSSDTQEVAK